MAKSSTTPQEEEVKELIAKSVEAKQYSYSPYSKFRVGAALLTQDGLTFTGCNVENAAHGPSICAERTAIVKAVSEGHRKFKAIAISSDLKEGVISPCGVCRQTLAEFGLDIDVFMTSKDGSYKMEKISDLLPHCFVPRQLLEHDGPSKT